MFNFLKPALAKKLAPLLVPSRLSSRCLAGLIFGGGLLTTVVIVIEYQHLTHRRETAIVEQNLLQVKTAIERTLTSRSNLIVSLAAVVESHAQHPEHRLDARDLELDFQLFTSAIERQVEGVFSMQLAPDGIVTYLTNLEANRKALGFDILVDPRRQAAALTTIQKRSINLSGPVELRQGGEAVIARSPIFIPGAFNPQDYINQGRAQPDTPWLQTIPADFWGFAVVLIDTQTLYREAGLDQLSPDYRYALRGRHGTGAAGEIFWGDAAVFANPLQTIDIDLPNGTWMLGVQSIYSPGRVGMLMILVVGSSISGLLSYAILISRKSKENAEASSHAKGEFLAVMSHELRTPLNGIIGLTELALHTNHSDDQPYYLEKIHSSSHLLLRIVNDILDFSKLEAGKFQIIAEPFCLDDILSSLRDLLALKAVKKDLEFLFKIGADVPNQLIGDSLRLSQILINLVANAIKFTEQGSVTLAVERIAVEGDRIRLQFDICDTGVGLTSAQISTLFTAFHQVHDFKTRSYGGTGLGLTICQRLLDLMGGTITIHSESGRGSRFRVYLDFDDPITDTAPSPVASQMAESSTLSDRSESSINANAALQLTWQDQRCLVADDNPNTARAIATMLETFGLQVIIAHSGTEAIEQLLDADFDPESGPFNLLLIDDTMPEMSGYETIVRLDADFLITPLKRVLLLPPHCSIVSNQYKHYNGIDYQLQKPIDRRQLRDLLEAITHDKALPDSYNQSSDTALPEASTSTNLLQASPHRIVPPLISSTRPNSRPPRDHLTPDTLANPSDYRGAYAMILLVEDNEVNQLVAQQMLQRLGYDVEIANDGYEAVNQVRSRRYDLILMDVQMPKMDGLESTHRIRQLASSSEEYRWCATVPIVAMTAHTREAYQSSCLEAGMNAQITKPITIELLSSALAQWLPPVPAASLSPAGILPHQSVQWQSALEQARNSELKLPSQPSSQISARSPATTPPGTAPETNPEPTTPTATTPTTLIAPPSSTASLLSLNHESKMNVPEFPGLSVQAGLQRMGNDWHSYRDLLEMFTRTYRNFEQELSEMIDREDYTQARNVIHTLKGAAGNLSAEGLMRVAQEFESELNAETPHPDRVLTLLLRTIHEFHQLLTSIDGVMKYLNTRFNSNDD